MTRAETIRLLGLATMAYPQWQTLADEQITAMAELWHRMLGDLDYRLAEAALQKHIATSRFPPTVAEIREAVVALQPREFPDAEEAWHEVLQAMKRVGYMRQPEWSHPIIGRVVQAMWGSWANACQSVQVDTLGVDRRHFLDMYATLTKRQREMALLPPAVRQLAARAAEQFRALPSGEECGDADHDGGAQP